MSLKTTKRSRSRRPNANGQKKQPDGVLFGNLLAQTILTAARTVLQRDYEFSEKDTTDFVGKVVTQVREDTGQNPPAPGSTVVASEPVN